jgi:hypothetical protein
VIAGVARAGRKVDVDVRAEAGALAGVLDLTGVGGEAAVLVDGDREHARVGGEDPLAPVAVVRVDVDDRHAADPELDLRGAGGDSAVVEDAEAVARVAPGMVSRPTEHCVRVGDLSLEHELERRQGRAGAEQSELVRAGVRRRVPAARVASAGGRDGLHPPDVLERVHAHELLDRRHARRDGPEHRVEPGPGKEVARPDDASGVVDVDVVLEEALGGQVQRAPARVVDREPLVPAERCRHPAFLLVDIPRGTN